VKLLFDQNLSRVLVAELRDIFPDSLHTSDLALEESDDAEVWSAAKISDCAIVTKDSDFHQRALLYGHPPKVIWLRVGNCRTTAVAFLLRQRCAEVRKFGRDGESSLLIMS
jgi:predicted nuclease of predicted toxin-antitoxin system